MPQVFQVLRCYKCSIFQVHQTKKDNKWICNICGEKQSVKRHYGLGTAKDCRIHVQKLNTISGDRNESLLKYIDSDDSNTGDNSENLININQNSSQLIDKNNITRQSKWSTYVENEVTDLINDSKEEILKQPKKRKINRNSKSFKVQKVSRKYNNSENIDSVSSNDEPKKSNKFLTSNNLANNTFYTTNTNQCDLKLEQQIQSKVENIDKSIKQQIIIKKESKWVQFLEPIDNLESVDGNKFVENNDHETQHIEDNFINYNEGSYNKNLCEYNTNNDFHSVSKNRNSIIFQCDDKDLDNILEF